jgi:large subunit ribosomal protein L24
MIQSSKPRKQRRYRFNAPLHQRQHFLNAHLDKQLRARIGRRAIRVSKGDTVKVMAGKQRGKTGKVSSVSLRRGRITISSLTRKNAKGKELPIFIKPSNVYITDLNLEDKVRAARLKAEARSPAPAARPAEGTKTNN